MKTIFVYGSLRKGLYNFNKYLCDSKFLGTAKINGWKMYNLGRYPAVVKSQSIESKIVIESFEVSDELYQKLDEMEKEADYLSEDIEVVIDNKKIKGTIWYFSKVPNNELVPDGDWKKV